jgi:hypothetical protein
MPFSRVIVHVDGNLVAQRTNPVAGVLPWLAIGCLVLGLLAPWPSYAEDVRVLNVSLRGGLSGHSPIGKKEIEQFQQSDVMATTRLPWEWYSESGLGVGTRLVTSGGALRAAGETAFIGTFVPGLAFGPKDGRFSLEIGGGFALLSQHKFGTQDMGGPFQFVWTTALRTAVYKAIGVGYCFQHMSDATFYGANGRGVDVHLFELSYRY